MREFKFRVWHKAEKKMFGVDYLHFTPNGQLYELLAGLWHRFVAVDDFELMQYTGLKDKNGREIYEGDILKVNGGEPNFEFVSPVIFDRGAFRMAAVYDQGFPAKEDMEVIGSIYENPELVRQ